jgi:hypothetical protein
MGNSQEWKVTRLYTCPLIGKYLFYHSNHLLQTIKNGGINKLEYWMSPNALFLWTEFIIVGQKTK